MVCSDLKTTLSKKSVALGVAWSKQLGRVGHHLEKPSQKELEVGLWGVVLPRTVTKLEPEEDLNSRESSCLLVSTTEEWGFVLREIVKI